MRPPKPRAVVQEGSSDPPQPRHQLSSNQIRQLQDMMSEVKRIVESFKSLPRTSGKVGVSVLEKRMDDFRVRQLAGTQKIADALRSIEGQNKKCEAQLPKKVQHANGQKKMCEVQLHKKVQLANGPKMKCEAQLPKKVQLENGQNNKCEAQLHKKVQLANEKNKKYEAQLHSKVQLAKGQNKKCEAQLPKKVQHANGQKKMYEVQLHKKVQLANGQKMKCEAQLPKKVQLENEKNKKYEAQLHSKVQLAKGGLECNKYYHQGSSSYAPTQKMRDCRICMQSKLFLDFFAINGCKHSYCSKCVGSYIEAKVNMNVALIRCPDPACKDGKLEPLTCKLIITEKVFDRWCDALSESTVRVKFYCPFKDCSALLIDERGQEVMRESECPHCHRLFCAHCRVPWHSGLSCREFLEMEKLGREKKLEEMLKELAQKSKWQRCPKCKFYVERISGCMFIKCRCGSSFCYGCASEMEVDHFCKKCKR